MSRTTSPEEDYGALAAAAEAHAQGLLAAGHNAEAERVVSAVAPLLEQGEQWALLAQALTTHGIALARLGRYLHARQTLERAISTAEPTGYSLRREMRRYEEHMIRRALKESGGAVPQAARLLGFRYHQSLVSLINARYKHLLRDRLPVKPRQRKERASRQRAPRDSAPCRIPAAACAVRVIYIEDDRLVRETVKDTLRLEGWQVEVCADAHAALRRLHAATRYDLIITDYEMPGMDGVEFVRRVRALETDKRTPIIMLTASSVAAAAVSAGVSAFLRKPEDIGRLLTVAMKLLAAPVTD